MSVDLLGRERYKFLNFPPSIDDDWLHERESTHAGIDMLDVVLPPPNTLTARIVPVEVSATFDVGRDNGLGSRSNPLGLTLYEDL